MSASKRVRLHSSGSSNDDACESHGDDHVEEDLVVKPPAAAALDFALEAGCTMVATMTFTGRPKIQALVNAIKALDKSITTGIIQLTKDVFMITSPSNVGGNNAFNVFLTLKVPNHPDCMTYTYSCPDKVFTTSVNMKTLQTEMELKNSVSLSLVVYQTSDGSPRLKVITTSNLVTGKSSIYPNAIEDRDIGTVELKPLKEYDFLIMVSGRALQDALGHLKSQAATYDYDTPLRITYDTSDGLELSIEKLKVVNIPNTRSPGERNITALRTRPGIKSATAQVSACSFLNMKHCADNSSHYIIAISHRADHQVFTASVVIGSPPENTKDKNYFRDSLLRSVGVLEVVHMQSVLETDADYGGWVTYEGTPSAKTLEENEDPRRPSTAAIRAGYVLPKAPYVKPKAGFYPEQAKVTRNSMPLPYLASKGRSSSYARESAADDPPACDEE